MRKEKLREINQEIFKTTQQIHKHLNSIKEKVNLILQKIDLNILSDLEYLVSQDGMIAYVDSFKLLKKDGRFILYKNGKLLATCKPSQYLTTDSNLLTKIFMSEGCLSYFDSPDFVAEFENFRSHIEVEAEKLFKLELQKRAEKLTKLTKVQNELCSKKC